MHMMPKKMFVCLMFLLFISASVTVISSSNKIANSTTTITVSPTTVTGPPLDINDTFTVYIDVINVTELYTWVMGMTWNSSILNCTNFAINYSFMPPGGIPIPGGINNTAGEIDPPFGYSLLLSGATGSGTIADVTFLVKAAGETSLNLIVETFLNFTGDDITYNVVNGTFSLPESDETSPTISNVTQTPEETNVTDGEAVTVSANVTDNIAVQTVILSYSNDSGTTWHNVTMTNTAGDTWEGVIPSHSVGTSVQYKIIAYDTSGNPAVEDNNHAYYVYTVVPEFPTALILPMLIVLLAVTVLAKKIRPRN